ncbi:MAG TPA: hypothetical protein VLJ17_11610 [Xanthobacteraceae bacterium]|nr:hypothetical protein [Xanthobacteraceae bacterium]
MRGIEATPGNTMTLARFMAERAVKAQWQAQGIETAYVEPSELASAARAYLNTHPELVEQAFARLRVEKRPTN